MASGKSALSPAVMPAGGAGSGTVVGDKGGCGVVPAGCGSRREGGSGGTVAAGGGCGGGTMSAADGAGCRDKVTVTSGSNTGGTEGAGCGSKSPAAVCNREGKMRCGDTQPSAGGDRKNLYPGMDATIWLRSCTQEQLEPLEGVTTGGEGVGWGGIGGTALAYF